MTKSLSQLEKEGVKFAVVKIDETKFWRDDIQKKAKQIFGVYLIDLTKPTHLCSIEINYPSECIKNFIPDTTGLSDDFVYDIENDENQDISYYLGRSVFEVAKEYKDGEYDEAFENERCNPSVC